MQSAALLASVHDINEDKFIKRLIQSHTGQDRPTWLGGKKSVSVFKCWISPSVLCAQSLLSGTVDTHFRLLFFRMLVAGFGLMALILTSLNGPEASQMALDAVCRPTTKVTIFWVLFLLLLVSSCSTAGYMLISLRNVPSTILLTSFMIHICIYYSIMLPLPTFPPLCFYNYCCISLEYCFLYLLVHISWKFCTVLVGGWDDLVCTQIRSFVCARRAWKWCVFLISALHSMS